MEYHDPRDIPENAISKANDVMVDRIGKVRMMGRVEPHPVLGNPSSDSVLKRIVPPWVPSSDETTSILDSPPSIYSPPLSVPVL